MCGVLSCVFYGIYTYICQRYLRFRPEYWLCLDYACNRYWQGLVLAVGLHVSHEDVFVGCRRYQSPTLYTPPVSHRCVSRGSGFGWVPPVYVRRASVATCARALPRFLAAHRTYTDDSLHPREEPPSFAPPPSYYTIPCRGRVFFFRASGRTAALV